jgi:hypothetical protein
LETLPWRVSGWVSVRLGAEPCELRSGQRILVHLLLVAPVAGVEPHRDRRFACPAIRASVVSGTSSVAAARLRNE